MLSDNNKYYPGLYQTLREVFHEIIRGVFKITRMFYNPLAYGQVYPLDKPFGAIVMY